MKVTVDLIAIAEGHILLIKRRKAPFMDKLVLPGGHVEEDDLNLVSAVMREAEEEIGLIINPSELKLLTVLDAPDRDPRPGKRISIVYLIKLSELSLLQKCKPESDALEIVIIPLEEIKEEDIGFDHYEAIKKIASSPE